MKSIIENRIRTLAYQIWESEGCPHGQDQRHWKMAKTLLNADAGILRSTAVGKVLSVRARNRSRTTSLVVNGNNSVQVTHKAGRNVKI